MKVGYARTSTLDQKAGLESQERDLKAAGCEMIFTEQVSSVDVAQRLKLDETLIFIREGDVLIVTRLDRLARSVPHLLGIVERLERKGVTLQVLSGSGNDIATPTGKLLLTILGAVAEFERGIMLERQREGIAKAKGEGKYRGRKPTAQAKGDQVKALRAQGLGAAQIAQRLGIGRASVYRIIAADFT